MNTADEFRKKIAYKILNVNRYLRRLPKEIGNIAVEFFNEQFKRQQSPEGNPWQQRKTPDAGRNLLVKSGRLRKSIRIVRADQTSVRIGSNVLYGKYHNEGTNRLPQRQFIGKSKTLMRRIQRVVAAGIIRELRK